MVGRKPTLAANYNHTEMCLVGPSPLFGGGIKYHHHFTLEGCKGQSGKSLNRLLFFYPIRK
jgi:hypothetical protein